MRSWWNVVAAYPPTWLVVVLIVAAEWVLFDWFRPSIVGALVLLGVGALSALSWPLVLSATGTVHRLQLGSSKRRQSEVERIDALKSELEELEDDRPSRQLESIQEKRDSLVDVLGKRLDAGEMTYARYLTAGRQVVDVVLDNLGEIALGLRSIDAIDSEYLDRRLGELASAAPGDTATDRERASLTDRQQLLAAQKKKVADLLAQNEAAMTAIDKTTAALADAPIGKTPEDAEQAMAALEELAHRAGRYATS